MDDLLKIVPAIIQAISVAVAAYFAVQSLRTWRKQLVGKRRFEVAEDAILSAYRVGEKLEWIRNGAAFEGEMAAREREPNEREDEARLRDSYWVPLKRIADASEDFAGLNKARLLCKIHFGAAAANAIEDLLRIRIEVSTASHTLVRSVGQHDEDRNREFLESMRNKMWAHLDENDELTRRTKESLSRLERNPVDLNRDSHRRGKGGVLAGDSAFGVCHGQSVFVGLARTGD